jgi:CrcB protein
VSLGVYGWLGRGFPYGTLAVNVIGCLAMSLLLVERSVAWPARQAGLLVGVLGGLTTFSSFSMETMSLLEDGEPLRAAANMAASLVLCLGATWLGVVGARQL